MVAVEDTAVQVSWRDLPPGETVVTAGDAEVRIEGGWPGAALLDGLPPATPVDVIVALPGGARRRIARVATLAPPPGPALARVATISDLHLGSTGFGRWPYVPDHHTRDPHPIRCVRSALESIRAWQPDLLVVKGDLTERGQVAEWEAAARLLAEVGVPVVAVPGNHDTVVDAVDGTAALAAHGIELTYDVAVRDVPGLRVIAANTTVPGQSAGTVAPRTDHILDALAAAPGPVLLAGHHYPEKLRVPTMWPPGIPAPESSRFLDRVAATNPATLYTSGHSHRHRRHRHGPLHLTEVGAPKDFPGTWSGYAVHEGGVRQVVRWIEDPVARAWIERTRHTFFSLWQYWSPGRLEARCFTITWPDRTVL